MAELRLGVDPRPGVEGLKQYQAAAEGAIGATERLSRTVGTFERAIAERSAAERQVVEMLHAEALAIDRVHQATIARQRAVQRMGQVHAQALAMDQQRTRQMTLLHAEALRMNAAFDGMGAGARRTGLGVGRLNDALFTMLRTTVGVNPVLSRTTDLLLTFGLGTAVSTAIIGGLTAIAVAFDRITRSSREAREETRRHLDALEEMARQQALPAGGEAALSVEAGRQRIRDLETRLRDLVAQRAGLQEPRLGTIYAPGAGGLTAEALTARIQEISHELGILRQRVLAGGVVAAGNEVEFWQRRLREIGPVSPTDLSAGIATWQAAFDRDMARRQFEVDIAGGFGLYRVGAAPGAGVAAGIGQQQYEEQQRLALEAAERELEITRDRERAYDALTQGLYEAGRAYGGVTGEVLALTAALIDMSRVGPLPMDSFGDQARGYGAAALYGIGVGSSTGSSALGAAGGGVGGYFMTGNPYGAILGATAGFVSGLFAEADRARQAAAAWEVAFRDFQNLFEPPTDRMTLDRAFAQNVQAAAAAAGVSTSIATIEEARRQAALIDAQGNYAGTGIRATAGAVAFDKMLEQLIEQYERHTQRLDENGNVIDEVTDSFRSLTSALNAPSGFRLSLYEWLAGAGGPPVVPGDDMIGGGTWPGGIPGPTDGGIAHPGGITIQALTINVNGSDDPRAVALATVNELRQIARLGGPDPLLLPRS